MTAALLLIAGSLWAWSIADVIAVDESSLHPGEKEIWLVVVLAVPAAGAAAWLLLGRSGTQHTDAGLRRRVAYGWPPHPGRIWGGTHRRPSTRQQ